MQTKEQFLNSLIKKEDKVKEALTKLYQGVRATNEFLGLKNSQELQSTYYQLRVEEISELFTAIENNDKVEFLDAIVDGLVVVGYEAFIRSGVPSENQITLGSPNTFEQHINELETIFKNKSEIYTLNCLFYLENLFNELNIDHIKATNEVLESNWSKFPTKKDLYDSYIGFSFSDYTLDELYYIECKTIENNGRYVGVHHEIRVDNEGNERIIFWANGEKQSDGSIKEFKAPKYVKPCTYKNPDFASCWLN